MPTKLARRVLCIALLVALCPAAAFADRSVIKIPGQQWAISFDSPALLGAEEQSKDGNFAFGANSGLFNISLFVEKPRGSGATHQDCYQFYWPGASRNPLIEKKSIAVKETTKYVRVEYDVVADIQGTRVRHRNVNYFIAYQDKWIDVHISFVEPGEKDDAMFAAFDETLDCGPADGFPKPADRLSLDPRDAVANVQKYVEEGTRSYDKQDFRKAADSYAKAFELEKQVPTLVDLQWKILVDNLGMSYGISGQLDKAKQVFEYGLLKAPTYPMFHYNLACAYAEMGKRDETISSLRRAFQFKQNMLPGETLPDPGSDSSFQQFMKDAEFVKALKEIRGRS